MKKYERGFTLVELLAVVAVLAIIVAVSIGASGCRSDLTYGRTVKGKVASTGSRYSRTEGGGKEKIALQLSPFFSDEKVRDTAGGSAGLDVECVSTRCSALTAGQCVELVCSYEHRWWEPSVVECKMVHTIDCAALGTK